MRIDQEVGGLDVAMEDSQAVGMVERVGCLSSERGDVATKQSVLM